MRSSFLNILQKTALFCFLFFLIRDLRSTGLFPDFIVCRSENEMSVKAKQKLAMHASLDPECILSNWNVKNILEVPIILKN